MFLVTSTYPFCLAPYMVKTRYSKEAFECPPILNECSEIRNKGPSLVWCPLLVSLFHMELKLPGSDKPAPVGLILFSKCWSTIEVYGRDFGFSRVRLVLPCTKKENRIPPAFSPLFSGPRFLSSLSPQPHLTPYYCRFVRK